MNWFPAKIEGLSPTRIGIAMVLAAISDGLSLWLEFLVPAQWAADLVTALVLFAVLGRRWLLLPALVIEAIPGAMLFPSWVLAVAAIGAAALGLQRPPGTPPPPGTLPPILPPGGGTPPP